MRIGFTSGRMRGFAPLDAPTSYCAEPDGSNHHAGITSQILLSLQLEPMSFRLKTHCLLRNLRITGPTLFLFAACK